MGLRKFMDNIKPTFSKGGKLGFLESTFDAFETFLFVPNTTTSKGAHIRDCNDMKRTMIMVVAALMPAFLFGCYNTGIQVGLEGFTAFFYGLVRVLPMVCVSYIVGLGIEFGFAQARGHEVNEGFLVTGLLIPMIFPVSTPLWMVALSTAFAVVFGKEVFGGTGMNVFNPALLARAFAFFAYTPSMSGETVWYSDWTMMGAQVDGITGATALEQLGTTGAMNYSPLDAFLGFIPGSFAETSTLAILLGGAILLFTGIASWRTMASVFVGGLAMGYLPGARRDDLSRLVSPDRRRLRLRCGLHGHRSRDFVADQHGQIHRRPDDRRAGRADPRGQPGLSRGHDAFDPLYECAGAAGRLLRGRGQHLAPPQTCQTRKIGETVMATKKFKCNVCGYIHEGDAAPANCPVCGVPASEFTELKPEKKGLFSDKNGNAYIIMYSTVMVVIVATLLALAALGLQKRQYENELNEKKHAILASLSAGDRSYDEFIDAYVVDKDGRRVDGEDVFALLNDLPGTFEAGKFPIFEARDGRVVIPVTGMGLWGPVWGYVALEKDMNTVAGIIMAHKGETPGLGAEIATPKYQANFVGKTIFDGDKFVSVTLRKGGAKDPAHEVDAISGGTKTSDGVTAMLYNSLENYLPLLEAKRNAAAPAPAEVSNEENVENNE